MCWIAAQWHRSTTSTDRVETATGFNSRQVSSFTLILLKLTKPIFSSFEIEIAQLLVVLYTLINHIPDKKCYAVLKFLGLLNMYSLNYYFYTAVLAIFIRCWFHLSQTQPYHKYL